MARESYSPCSTDDEEPEVPDPAAQDSTVALATADAAPATTSTAAAASTNGANAQREITSDAARGTMNTVADPQAITNAVANNPAANSSSPALQQNSTEVGSTSQGCFTLITSLLFQKSCPKYAVLAAHVGVTCVTETLLFVAAVHLPPQLEPVVWVFAASVIAVYAIACYNVYKKGIRNSGEGA
ncbi:hypothetical protein Nepgr_017115 [Nepenthes gracilis]|uniref:Uncharacterized protein n=1 Tax=Nepenthes gracilis TaxID=150966 RepID=A0AAD3SQZ8_NEPGR|nr:hypothetical protein Nepgr_017115 [Nepenthes gracilis]